MPPVNVKVDALFPIKLASFDFSEHREKAAQIVRDIVQGTPKAELTPPDDWSAKLTTNFANKSQFLPQTINDDLERAIKTLLQAFIPEGTRVSSIKYEYWFNHYLNGEYQEVHAHVPNFVSGVWFLEGNPSDLNFYNSFQRMYLDPPNSKYQGGVGSICMFPSTTPHYVEENACGERITVAFNVFEFDVTEL
jgi:hypothetical protein